MDTQVLKYLPTLGVWLLAIGLLVLIERVSLSRYQWDHAILSFVHEHRSLWLDRFFVFITWVGSLFILVPVATLIIGILIKKSHPTEAWLLFLSLVGITFLSRLTKLWFARPRPDLFPVIGKIPLDASYPSAHTAQIVAFSVAVWWILRPEKLGFTYFFLTCIALLLPSMVAFSRIYLQVHFPSDVLGGVLLGFLWVMGLLSLLHNILLVIN
jgi:membrane-associated phospholipid phosphatase